jgi:DNA-binding XRE family transcriptional regulator
MADDRFVRPEWAERITKFRESQKLSQAGLAKRLNVSPMAPSRWERGINEPSSDIYMQLGKMAGDPDCWYFWQRGGLSRDDINSVVPGFGAGSPDLGTSAAAAAPTKATPTLNISLIVRPDLFSSDSEEVIAVPAAWCPNPERIICVRIDEDGMAPIVGQGFIVAIDTSVSDPNELQSALIAVLNRDNELLIRCLALYGETHMLVGEDRRRAAIPYNDRDWKIVGRVLWWVGKAGDVRIA